MKILFVHQNFPAQFKHVVPALLKDINNQVVVFTMNKFEAQPNLKVVRYKPARGTAKDVHPWAAEIETKVIRGEAAFRSALMIKKQGFEPDLILAHPGWGESLFLKQVWPKAKMIIYCEFHYGASGLDIGFDPEFISKDEGEVCRVQMKNANNFLHFDIADVGISPTKWQRSTFPEPFRSKIEVVHDGIATNVLKPNPDAWIGLGKTRQTREDEIITFVNRNLEPTRGYHIFMRALPAILRERPNSRVVIVGGSGVSYGANAPLGKTWKQIFLDEVKNQLDLSRVHFVGNIGYQHFISLLQVSRVHVYLTYPFVLSWSLLEAMSCGCAIVASDTAPLREVIIHNKTGLLTPFFDPQQLSQKVIDLLRDKELRGQLGSNARQFIIDNYDLSTVCLPKMLSIIKRYA